MTRQFTMENCLRKHWTLLQEDPAPEMHVQQMPVQEKLINYDMV
jgi:hypothetical protein